jgi:hypothetical protein
MFTKQKRTDSAGTARSQVDIDEEQNIIFLLG